MKPRDPSRARSGSKSSESESEKILTESARCHDIFNICQGAVEDRLSQGHGENILTESEGEKILKECTSMHERP